MPKHLARKLTLAATLTVLSATAADASTSNASATSTLQSTVSPDSVTGTDPEPTSPNIIQVILAFLHLA
jgi:hypothetical protein